MYKNCILFYDNLKSHYKSFSFYQYFHYILQMTYLVSLFYIYIFYSLNIVLSHDLSHSNSNILGFQINPLSHLPLSINSLHSHLDLSLFQRCLLLETLASNLHLHLQVSCHFISRFSFVLDIRLNNLIFMFLLTSGIHNLAYGSLILLQLPVHLFTRLH